MSAGPGNPPVGFGCRARALMVGALLILAGCASAPIAIQTEVIERLVPVPCKIEPPAECRADYAVDRLPASPDDVTINRALRAEIEERAACEVKLRAAVQGCNQENP